MPSTCPVALDDKAVEKLARIGLFELLGGEPRYELWRDKMKGTLGGWVEPYLDRVWEQLPDQALKEAEKKGATAEDPHVKLVRKVVEARHGATPHPSPSERERNYASAASLRQRESRAVGEPASELGQAQLQDQVESAHLGRRPGEVRPLGRAGPSRPLEHSQTLEWSGELARYGLPKDLPRPDERISPAARAPLFGFQRPLADALADSLRKRDAAILAMPTGSGKTTVALAAYKDLAESFEAAQGRAPWALALAPSRAAFTQWRAAADRLGLKLTPTDEAPKGPGLWAMTYATAQRRPELLQTPFDFALFDESHVAARWFREGSGKPGTETNALRIPDMLQRVAAISGKVMYISATPFDHALALGYAGRLGLWPPGPTGFMGWGRYYGIRYSQRGGWSVAPSPLRLLGLREQLVRDGHMILNDRDLTGHRIDVAVAPLTPQDAESLRQAASGFLAAENYYRRRGFGRGVMGVRAHAVNYLKATLERLRLPAVARLVKQLNTAGWQVPIFIDTWSPALPENYKLLSQADERTGGAVLSRIPPLTDASSTLKAELGDSLGLYLGASSQAREAALRAFNQSRTPNLLASYSAGGLSVDMHDTVGDRPRAAVFVGPPWSGITLDQALGRAYRVTSRSRAWSVILGSNAEAEYRLLTQKVIPRMQHLNAIVSGVVDTGLTQRASDLARFIGYAMGQEEAPDISDLVGIHARTGIQTTDEIDIPSAEAAMWKLNPLLEGDPKLVSEAIAPAANATIQRPESLPMVEAQHEAEDFVRGAAKPASEHTSGEHAALERIQRDVFGCK